MKKPSRRTVRRVLTGLAVTLALAGVGMMVYPFATDLWAARLQRGLEGAFAVSAEDYRRGVAAGDPVTRLEIPTLGVDVMVVEGTSLSALRAGAGHYPETPLPGEPGNVAIAGHRTTYGKPFNRIDELRDGDRVVLTTPLGRHVYEVMGEAWVVDDEDWSVIEDHPKKGSFLTLTSCHPEGSAEYRIVARARLVRTAPALTAERTS